MGIIRMGVPEDIALFLKNKYNVKRFVETGTFYGGTCSWAAQHFDQVDTIEYSEPIYLETKKSLHNIKNINFIFGDSRQALKEIISSAKESIVFWLDAHWCSMGSYGSDDQCPLIEELKIINNSPLDHFILIDDARLFMAPPPLPNLIKFYPDINKIIGASPNQSLTIYEDVIFIMPYSIEEDFSDFLQQKTTKAWQEYGEEQERKLNSERVSKVFKTKRLMGDLLKVWNLK